MALWKLVLENVGVRVDQSEPHSYWCWAGIIVYMRARLGTDALDSLDLRLYSVKDSRQEPDIDPQSHGLNRCQYTYGFDSDALRSFFEDDAPNLGSQVMSKVRPVEFYHLICIKSEIHNLQLKSSDFLSTKDSFALHTPLSKKNESPKRDIPSLIRTVIPIISVISSPQYHRSCEKKAQTQSGSQRSKKKIDNPNHQRNVQRSQSFKNAQLRSHSSPTLTFLTHHLITPPPPT